MGRRMRWTAAFVAVIAVLVGTETTHATTGTVSLVVADLAGGAIEQVDASSGTVGPPIPVGIAPVSVAITPNGRTAYVSLAFSDTVVPVDLTTSTAGPGIPLACPGNIAILPLGRKAYVSQGCGTTVTPIDLTTNTAGTPIEIGPIPDAIAVAPGGGTVYVTTGDFATPDALVPIDVDTDTAGTPVPLGETGGDPGALVVTPDGGTAFVALESKDTVVPLDLATGTTGAPIAVSPNPAGLAITPDGATLFVTHFVRRTPNGLGDPPPHDVTPIDVATRTALPQIVLGSQTAGIAVAEDGATAYVTLAFDTDGDTGSIVPIDVSTLTAGAPITVPGEPYALAIRPPLDLTEPTLAPTVTGSGPAGAVLLHDPAAAAHANADDGGGSGVASESCDTPDVATVGPHTVTCTATDVAGNTATADVTYVVEYRLAGLSPADGSTARAGKPLRIGVTLTDAGGVTATACAGCDVTVQMFSVGGAGQDDGPFAMSYHKGSDEYRYTWKPSSSTQGTTRIVVAVGYPGTAVTTTAEALVTIS